jgi:medium-chain acyl-[acyl-carrier-protein] hydrolase
MNLVWSGAFPIHTYEVDPGFRLSVPALLGFLQEAAGHNADALGFSIPQLAARNLTWMLSRLRVRLREHPGWRASLTVETWPCGFSRLFALRDFRLRLEGRVIGEAASAWLLMDLGRRRPVRPESAADWSGLIHPERAFAADLEKLPPFPPADEGLRQAELGVRYCDLDVNLHANNLRYVEWVLESLPGELLRSSVPRELDLDFLAEAGAGERILSRSAPLAGGAFAHTLVRLADGVEVARARSAWQTASPVGAAASPG